MEEHTHDTTKQAKHCSLQKHDLVRGKVGSTEAHTEWPWGSRARGRITVSSESKSCQASGERMIECWLERRARKS